MEIGHHFLAYIRGDHKSQPRLETEHRTYIINTVILVIMIMIMSNKHKQLSMSLSALQTSFCARDCITRNRSLILIFFYRNSKIL